MIYNLEKFSVDHRTNNQVPKAWITDTGKVYRDRSLADANTLTGSPEPLFIKPKYTDDQLVALADLWSPNDKLEREKFISFARKLLG
jgi:hypothetical protein